MKQQQPNDAPGAFDQRSLIDTHTQIINVLSHPYPFTVPIRVKSLKGTLIISAMRTRSNFPFPGALDYLDKIARGIA